MAIVSVENLKMSYDKGRVKALKGVTFDVEEGEIFGLIGGSVYKGARQSEFLFHTT